MRVLIGTPTNYRKNYCFDEFAENVNSFSYPFDWVIVDNSPNLNNSKRYEKAGAKIINRIPRGIEKEHGPTKLLGSQNAIRDYFLEGPYTHLLMLESDVFPRHDIIEYMLAHNKPVFNVSYLILKTLGICVYNEGLYHKSGSNSTKMLNTVQSMSLMKGNTIQLGKHHTSSNVRISGCGVGCTLIRRDVLQKVPFRVDIKHDNYYGVQTFADSFWHRDVNRADIENVLDLKYIAEHKFSVINPMENTDQLDEMIKELEQRAEFFRLSSEFHDAESSTYAGDTKDFYELKKIALSDEDQYHSQLNFVNQLKNVREHAQKKNT